MEDRKDLVYSVPCTCGVRYVGETEQHYWDRKSQHQVEVKNKETTEAFYSHIKRNKGHRIEREDCVYLYKEKNWRRRKIKEEVYINALNPTESMVRNGNSILNLEKGYEFDPIWSGFNPDIRNVIKKKIKFTKR